MIKRLIAILSSLLCLTILSGQTVQVELISKMDGEISMENGATTTLWGYGYDTPAEKITLPAPLLQFTVGDTVVVQFTNLSGEGHTIHLHGLDVDQVNDGVPQTSFTVTTDSTVFYSFVATHPGTYLYHCHVTTTLHLTMGMYGMISINHPDELLFENGPGYNKLYHFLASDLDKEVNDSPITSFPFHTMRMNYFMVNGKSGEQLFDGSENIIEGNAGDSILLRLTNIAYSKTLFIFPPLSNPVVYMSDGRPLPEPFVSDTLEIYPGERFSVVLNPEFGISDSMEVQYYNMLDKGYSDSNFIGMNISGPSNTSGGDIEKEVDFSFYPNPTDDLLFVNSNSPTQQLQLLSLEGKLIETFEIALGDNTINTRHLPAGVYFLKNHFGTTKKLIVF